MLDFSKIKTISIRQRKNKVKLTDLIKPENSKILFESKDFDDLVSRIIDARKNKKQVILMMGAHVIKTGMSLLVIDLMKKGVINHDGIVFDTVIMVRKKES